MPARKIASSEEIIVCVTSLRLDRSDCWKWKRKCVSRIHQARKLWSKSFLWFSSNDAFIVWGKCFYFRVVGVWSPFCILPAAIPRSYVFLSIHKKNMDQSSGPSETGPGLISISLKLCRICNECVQKKPSQYVHMEVLNTLYLPRGHFSWQFNQTSCKWEKHLSCLWMFHGLREFNKSPSRCVCVFASKF